MRHGFTSVVFKLVDHTFQDSPTKTYFEEPRVFQDLLLMWRDRHVHDLSSNTKIRYRVIEGTYDFFRNYQICDIRSQHVDIWLELMIRDAEAKRGKRLSFVYELRILKSIFRFYKESFEHVRFEIPIRKRHFQRAVIPGKIKKISSKNLTRKDFDLFRKSLHEDSHEGKTLSYLATLHFLHALRISEVAAIHWEDIYLNEQDPASSFLRIRRSYKWHTPRKAVLENGFKNSEANQGIKDLPLFPESYRLIVKMKKEKIRKGETLTGLLFHTAEGKPFSYRMIQYAYDCAFKRQGLNFSGTHILRHGGCRDHYRKNENLEIAQQLLGNTNIKNTIIYTESKGEALAKSIRREWKKKKSA
jgi:integrase